MKRAILVLLCAVLPYPLGSIRDSGSFAIDLNYNGRSAVAIKSKITREFLPLTDVRPPT
jgi:hypothetical protein